MLYREIMAVCSEIHTKQINTVCVQQGQMVGLTVSTTGTDGGAYGECNREKCGGLLRVQQGQMVGLTVNATGNVVGAYCECNRDRECGLL